MVLTVDRARFPRDKACAEYCTPGVAQILQRSGAWAAVSAQARAVRGMTVSVGGQDVLSVTYARESHKKLAFTLPRMRLDHLLLDHARKQGTDAVEGCRIMGVERGSREFIVSGIDADGTLRTWAARSIVGADGLQSVVARTQGVRVTQPWPKRIGLVTHYRVPRTVPDAGTMHVGKGIYVGLAPLPSTERGASLVNVGLVMSAKTAHALHQMKHERLLDAALGCLPQAQEFLAGGSQVKRTRGVAVIHRHVDRASGRGFLLVGDAAGFLDPFTGEGIYRAVRGSELAAEIIDGAMNQCSDAIPDFSGYEQLRQREFTSKSRFTWAIQAGLCSPGTFTMASRRIQKSPSARTIIGDVLGDVRPASQLVSPSFYMQALLGR